MHVYVHMHVDLWKAQSANADFTDLRGNVCVLIRDTHPRAQIGKDSSTCSPLQTLSDSSSRAALSQPESVHL